MKRVLFLFIGCIIVLNLSPEISRADVTPRLDIATPMPHPNGYDYFIRAGEAFVPDDKGVDEVTSTKYVEGKIYPLAPKEAWLKQNADAFHLLREGLKYPARQPSMRAGETFIPNYSRFRSLVRALLVESHVYAQRGESGKAASSLLDIIDFSYAVPRGGGLIGNLVGNAITSIGIRDWEDLMPHLDANTSKASASRLEQIYDGRFPYYKTQQDEKMSTQDSLRNVLKQNDWRRDIARGWNLSAAQSVALLFLSKRDVMDEYSRLMDAQIDNAHLPYRKMQTLPVNKKYPVAPLIFNIALSRWNQARSDTRCVLTMTMLALRAYKLNYGKYPTDLQQLVPNYLRRVPIDPFDGMIYLHYRLENEDYRLWSIGPDGVNNNGRPIENKNGTGLGRYRSWFLGDNGDVVAGINVP